VLSWEPRVPRGTESGSGDLPLRCERHRVGPGRSMTISRSSASAGLDVGLRQRLFGATRGFLEESVDTARDVLTTCLAGR